MYYILTKEDSQGNLYYLTTRLISTMRSIDFGNKDLLEQFCWHKSSNFRSDFTKAVKLHSPDLSRSLFWNLKERYPDVSIQEGITSPAEGEKINLVFIEVSFTNVNGDNINEHVMNIAKGKLTEYELSLIMSGLEPEIPEEPEEPEEDNNDENDDSSGETGNDAENEYYDEEPDEAQPDVSEESPKTDDEDESEK